MFFSRAKARVFQLEKFLTDPVTEPNFSLSPPDLIELTTTKLPIDEYAPERHAIHLGELDLH
jgi:hypothetical protein